jgi:hypothetical protein
VGTMNYLASFIIPFKMSHTRRETVVSKEIINLSSVVHGSFLESSANIHYQISYTDVTK